MSHTPFIAAAYAVTVTAIVVLILHAFRAMRRAERAAERLRRR